MIKNILAMALTVICLTVNAQITTASFASRVNFNTSNGPAGISHVDLNGDGLKDIVVANPSSNTINIYRNLSSGNTIQFAAPIDSATYNTPTFPIIGDLNNDGKPDIVVCHMNTNALKIFINQSTNGNILFAPGYALNINASSPAYAVIDDLDNDGRPDLVTSNFNSNNITVIRNLTTIAGGTPVFGSGTNILAGPASASPRILRTGYLTNDSLKEIVLANYTGGAISIYRNLGAMSFATPVGFNTSNLVTGLSISDLDNDGKADIIIGNQNANTLSILKNNSTATLSFAPSFTVSTPTPIDCAVEDLDGDNKPELIAITSGGATCNIFKNNANGLTLNAQSFSSSVSFATNLSPNSLCIEDFNNDGKPDIAFTNNGSNNFSVLRNTNLAAEPTIASSNITVTQAGANLQITLTKGNGNKRIVFVGSNNPVLTLPEDGFVYSANNNFGMGSNIGNNTFAIYNDTGNSFILNNLPFNQTYFISAFEYNGSGNYTNYLTNNYAISNQVFLANIFYAKASGALDSLTSWGRNPDGTGVSPTSFNEPNTFYIVTNNNNPTLSNNWFVTGNNTAIIVNGGYNLVVPAQFTFGADSIVVLANATITLNGNLFANKAFFDTLSNAQYTGIVPQNILGFNYFNLTVSGSVKTLANHTTARNFLTMLSNINTNGFNLTVGSSAGNTGNINLFGTYINGKLTRWIPTATQSATLLFPVGTSNNYLPAQLIFNNNLTNGGTISCEFISGNPGNGGLPLFDFTTSPVVNINKAAQNGVWRFEAANGLNLGTTNFNITLNASGFWGVNNYNELRIIRRPVSGSWNIVGNAGSNMGSNQSPIVVRNAVNLFGDFTIGGDLNNNPLPVGLTRFSGNWMNNHIILNWQTAFEENASGFTIEKLANNQWIEAGFVPAKGNTSRLTNYTFTDENPALKQDNYYRLKLLDIDHAFEYSKVIVVNQNQPDNLLNIWPNPAGQQLHINGLFEPTLVEVYNQNGKLVKTSTTTNQLNISELENGLYFIKTNGQTARFLKVE